MIDLHDVRLSDDSRYQSARFVVIFLAAVSLFSCTLLFILVVFSSCALVLLVHDRGMTIVSTLMNGSVHGSSFVYSFSSLCHQISSEDTGLALT